MIRTLANPRRRATILIVTMWIVIILTGLVLTLAQAIRVETICSANELSALQADAIEQAAIQYVRARVDSLKGLVPADADTPCEAVQVGQGAFWILRPNFDNDRACGYGIADEASKLNLNTANLAALSMLPGITDELAAGIVDWRDTDEDVTPNGGESQYYLLLPSPYQCKNAPLETVEELFLVKGSAQEILFGEDTNRNGVLDPNEDDGNVTDPPDNRDGKLDPGLFHFVTVYSVERNTSADGQRRINVNDAQSQPLADLLRKDLSTGKAAAILAAIPRQRPFRNILDFYFRTGLTAADFRTIADRITTSADPVRRGLINVNTAPAQVLACLPGLDDSAVSALIAKRAETGVDLTTIAWVVDALRPEAATAIGGLITAQSYRFSADIVSVAGDGRAFRRCRVVVDAQASPPKIIYRQDLTQLGWPLDPEILARLRTGTPVAQLAPLQTLGTGGTR